MEEFKETIEDSPKSKLKEICSASGPWLHAWYDPMAHLKSNSSRLATVDITNDGNHALLIVDESKRLKVFRGMNLISSHKLVEHASCLSVFYPSSFKAQSKSSGISSSVPAVAVATGANIYIYRSMRPYFKFKLPAVDINAEESNIWELCRTQDISCEEALALLGALQLELTSTTQAHNLELTFRSMFILSITSTEDQLKYMEAYRANKLMQNNCITCLTEIKQSDVESNAISCLVAGTENHEVLILDPTGASISKTIRIPGVPFSISVIGLLAVDYRIIIATRSSTIYTIRNGKLLGNHIEMESNITAMRAFNQNIIMSCLNKTLYAYHIKGNNVKLWSLYFKDHITCIEAMLGNRFQGQNMFLVGFENGHVAMYNDNIQLHTLRFDPTPITAIKFGQYGREESTLIVLNQTGCLNVKIMSRRADLKSLKSVDAQRSSNLIQQEIPLDLPSITQLYLDQEQREKENAESMHKIWQKEIVKFRLKTNQEYIKVLRKGNGLIRNAGRSNNILLNVDVIGLGPYFTLHVKLKNIGDNYVSSIAVVLWFNHAFYEIEQPVLKVALLVPSLDYNYHIKVKCVDNNGNADPIHLSLIDDTNARKSAFPFMTAIIDMPIADIA